MKYFFALGSNPTLSISELTAVLNLKFGEKISYEFIAGQNIFIINSDNKIQAKDLIKRLGGTIKIGEINELLPKNNFKLILKHGLKLIKPGKGKFKFGISCYGRLNFKIKFLAMEIKKFLKEEFKINSRWVSGRDTILSSVIVEQNKLTSGGLELVLIVKNDKLYIGKTLAVQPFKELSFRDYGRPRRDDRSGMLPPKLAQIMLNLSGAKLSDTILDPFCGSGTIINEAILAGYKNIIGGDISKKAVDDSRLNADWIKNKFILSAAENNTEPTSKQNLQIYQADAASLKQFISPRSVKAIITEPYLGPQRGRINHKKIIAELEDLYSKALQEFKKILKPNGRAVIIFPIFNTSRGARNINPDTKGYKFIDPIPKNLLGKKNIRLTKRNTIIYGRPGQRVWREIVILAP